MKKTTTTGGTHLPSGMVSLKMFKMRRTKAFIIAYLDMRSGPKMKNYTFNRRDIITQTNVKDTVADECLKELAAEGVLNRKGKSLYKLNRQKMEQLYYYETPASDVDESELHGHLSEAQAYALDIWLGASESDFNVSESDTHLSENDANVSESDTDVSESDSIHSSKLHSSKLHSIKLDSKRLDSSEVHTKEIAAPKLPEIVEELLRKSPKEQVAWLDAVEAKKTLAKDLKDLKAGKDVAMTQAALDEFLNL